MIHLTQSLTALQPRSSMPATLQHQHQAGHMHHSQQLMCSAHHCIQRPAHTGQPAAAAAGWQSQGPQQQLRCQVTKCFDWMSRMSCQRPSGPSAAHSSTMASRRMAAVQARWLQRMRLLPAVPSHAGCVLVCCKLVPGPGQGAAVDQGRPTGQAHLSSRACATAPALTLPATPLD